MTANQPYLMAISRRYDMIRLWMNKKGKAIGSEGWGLGSGQINGW